MHCINKKQSVGIPMDSSSLHDLDLKEDRRGGCKINNEVGLFFFSFVFDETLPFQLTGYFFPF